jgi:hypothetical protein
MEFSSTNNISISLLLVYVSLSSVITAFIIYGRMSIFMKCMWVAFVWMLPFLGSVTWLLIQSYDHKFQMDGGLRQELPS